MSDTFAVVEKEAPAVILGSNDFDDAFADAVADKPQEVQEEVKTEEVPAAEVIEEAPATEAKEDALPDYQGEIARLRAELEAVKQPPQQEIAREEPVQEPEKLYTPEQETALTEFRKEWPEVASGIDLMLQGAIKQAQIQVLNTVFSQLNPALAPVMEYYQTSAVDNQYNTLKQAHPDYDDIYDNVISWVDKQPNYMKTALQHVVTEGSAAEVVDMINRYKLETGKVTAPAVTAPKVTDLPEKAKQAARSLGVVSSKRSAVPQSQDPSDFDGAWAEAVNG
jgi:hypothetical protein